VKLRNPLKPQVIRNCAGEPYLVRWRLIWTNRFSLYLHHILRSDEDRELHDHPWSFVSIILKGEYNEITAAGSAGQVHGAGEILYRPAPWPHRLVLDRPVWTLVFVGPRKRRWGFHTPTGWVHWKLFLKAKGCGETDGQP
jgi:hypothetical protein